MAQSKKYRDSNIWWIDSDNLEVGVTMSSFSYFLLLFIDASLARQGLDLHEMKMTGKWTEKNSNLHTIMKIWTVVLTLSFLTECLTGNSKVLMSDSSTVVVYFNKQGGTVSKTLHLGKISFHV